MKRSKGLGALLRAVLVVGLVGMITTAVTFAALQSPPAAITNNTIETGSADLRINKDNTSLTTSITGFDFSGVIPGGVAYPGNGNTFYLKNVGSVNLVLRAAVTTTPSVTTVQPNGATVDLNKVFFIFSRGDTGEVATISLKALMDGNAAGGVPLNDTINANSSLTYSLRASIAGDAFTAQSASLSGINIALFGVGA